MKKFLVIFFILGIILIPSKSRKYIFIYYINLTKELPINVGYIEQILLKKC